MLWDEFRWDLQRDRMVKTQNIFNFPDAQAGFGRGEQTAIVFYSFSKLSSEFKGLKVCKRKDFCPS